MKQYQGRRLNGGVEVTVNGRPLDPRFDLRNHSPNGFEWSYGGSGPAQLALAILADCCGDEVALRQYQEFKREVIGNLPHDGWTLNENEVRQALLSQEKKGA